MAQQTKVFAMQAWQPKPCQTPEPCQKQDIEACICTLALPRSDEVQRKQNYL